MIGATPDGLGVLGAVVNHARDSGARSAVERKRGGAHEGEEEEGERALRA